MKAEGQAPPRRVPAGEVGGQWWEVRALLEAERRTEVLKFQETGDRGPLSPLLSAPPSSQLGGKGRTHVKERPGKDRVGIHRDFSRRNLVLHNLAKLSFLVTTGNGRV